MYGPGVEKIYDELKIKFPKKNIKIFSSDFLSNKKESINTIKQIEDNQGVTIVSEGLDANYFDMLNYAVFCLIKFSEKENNLQHQMTPTLLNVELLEEKKKLHKELWEKLKLQQIKLI